jgi:carbon storage regulator
MLVLSRRVGERVMIGETIVLTVVEVNRGRVRLGIEAPPAVPVWREELTSSPVVDTTKSPPRTTVPMLHWTLFQESAGDD